MTCPICGCKMPQKTMCIYCKVTGDQVENASNKKAKEKIKQHDRKEVYYSTTMPKDVNKTKLMLLTVLLGFLGIGDFYVGKYAKGIFCTTSVIVFMPFAITNEVIGRSSVVIKLFTEITSILVMMAILFWIADIITLLIKTYKVPVVLGPKEKRKR